MTLFSDIAVPEGGFRAIEADNPWLMKIYSAKGLIGRPQHYRRMTDMALKAIPVASVAAKDCHLFFWTSAPFLEKAFSIIRAWGFRYSSIAFTWVKLNPNEASALFLTDSSFHMGMGYTTRKNTEICLLAKRGNPKRKNKAVRELLISARREHSRKPDQAKDRIEQYADGPYLEMFSRTSRPGWVCVGDEAGKFSEEAA